MDIKELQVGDIFSESSHYTYLGIKEGKYSFKHHESETEVYLGENYIKELLVSSNIFTKEVLVGKMDKLWTAKQIDKALMDGSLSVDDNVRVGDVRVQGIRSIFEGIHSSDVFTVCFKKQDKPLSAKAYKELLNNQLETAIEQIQKVAKQKKGVSNKAEEVIRDIQNNPIKDYTPGESRQLTGYKIEFNSVDGKYKCVDMVINQPRPVNINTIEWLIYRGVKYIVK